MPETDQHTHRAVVAPLACRLLAEFLGTGAARRGHHRVGHRRGRRAGTGLTGSDRAAYTVAQVLGGIGGALLANITFGLDAVQIAQHVRAAYWFASSASFANPAAATARMFSDTFAGIAPASVPPFVVFQCIGAALGVGLALLLYPATATATDDVVVPRTDDALTAERNIR
jgi:glycerol uptake facilitator-like aquaporin